MKQGQYDLVEAARQAGLKRVEAIEFVKTVFDLIKESLEKDGIVKVKNLGTFKIIEMKDRESVDVNNGSRITIPGYKKIKFTPELSLKGDVNEKLSDQKVEFAAPDSWFTRFKKIFLK